MKMFVSKFQELLQFRPLFVGVAACLLMMSPVFAASGAYERGLRHYAEGDYESASRDFSQAKGERPGDANVYYYLADSYLKLNKLSEAQAEYQRVLAMSPESQAGRLSVLGLSRLRAFMNGRVESSSLANISTSRNSGRLDKYQGPPPSGDDYLEEVAQGGKITRWSLAHMPLKLYIERSPQGIRNFQPGFISQAQKAMDVWVKALNHQLSYVLVNDREQADIQVTWTNTIDTRGHSAEGGTSYTAGIMLPKIRNDQIHAMEVKIATFDIRGKAHDSNAIYAVAVHELGHSLGLMGHSPDSGDIMYAQNQTILVPSKRDINTLRRLYTEVADINNLPANSRKRDAKREAELSKKMDDFVRKSERLAKESPSALAYLNLSVSYYQKAKQLLKDGTAVEESKPETSPKFWYEKSLKAVNGAIMLEPKDPRAYHKRSLVYQELRDYPKALADIQKAISLDRNEPEYYLLAAWFHSQLRQTAQARGALDTYLLRKPGEADSPDVKRIRAALDGKAAQ